jgi:pyruvate kinase
MEADWFAASFIRDSRDVDNTRQLIEQRGGDQPIISKIEHRDAIKNIDEIIEVSDAVMVARGDLGVEMPPWEVPILQKRIIKKCNRTGKPVIIATQMLTSMVGKPRPTRAEVSDVTNAIIDGADAVMLSEETAIGLYPVESVKAMKSITLVAKEEIPSHTLDEPGEGASRADVIGSLLPWVTETLKPAAIIVVTRSGFSARMVSRHRPRTSIIAVTRSKRVEMRMRLYWGVETLDVDWTINRDELLWRTIARCLERGLVGKKDVVLVVSGSTLEAPGKTSSLEILKITDVLKKREV